MQNRKKRKNFTESEKHSLRPLRVFCDLCERKEINKKNL